MFNIRPVILCGGSGTRLWPLSRESLPKQFVPLVNGDSLLKLTIYRALKFGNPLFITSEKYRFLVSDVLLDEHAFRNISPIIILEPDGRNTAPAIAMAALHSDVQPNDLLLIMPSDHFVPNIKLFEDAVDSGISAALDGYIVTFGISPTFPSTAYGYIKQSNQLTEPDETLSAAYKVDAFVEKPSLDVAQQYLLEGNFSWNSGIFLCKASVLIQAMSNFAPDILSVCKLAMNSSQVDNSFLRPEQNHFLSCRSESIDYAVMEHFDKVAVVPFKGVWSDVGSWNAVAKLSPADTAGNRITGQGLAVQSSNTYINAPHRPVVALGASNLVIVDTLDAVLVAATDKVEQVKEVVAQLKKDGTSQAVMHRRVTRPWGWYDSIDVGERFQVKRIAVKPGASLSLQMHHHRAEHWVVVKGVAKVTNGEAVFLLKEDQSTYIPVGVKHRLENSGETDLEMIEVQSGDYLGEDDIVRFDDTYGRS